MSFRLSIRRHPLLFEIPFGLLIECIVCLRYRTSHRSRVCYAFSRLLGRNLHQGFRGRTMRTSRWLLLRMRTEKMTAVGVW